MAVIQRRNTAWRGAMVARALAMCVLLATGLLLAGCAAEEPPPDDLPLPPEPPARVQAARQPATGAPRPRGNEAEPTAPLSEAPATVAEPPPAPAAPSAWRVARDGTLGCADAAPLRLLRQGADTPPRLLAEARAAGACRTTFRLNAWALEAVEADLVRLRLVNGEALTLWFLRADVLPP